MTCDWFLGISRLSLRFWDVLAWTGTNPETQTARPPREGWRVALEKPEVLGAWTPAGRAPPGLEGRREEENCAVALEARARVVKVRIVVDGVWGRESQMRVKIEGRREEREETLSLLKFTCTHGSARKNMNDVKAFTIINHSKYIVVVFASCPNSDWRIDSEHHDSWILDRRVEKQLKRFVQEFVR